jgi:hypothetical protein
LIRYWIERGRFPSLDAARDENQAAKITPESRNFWSFKKPVRATTPLVKNSDQVRTPIDAFALRQLEQKGWKLSPATDRKTLVRRVYLDLIGMPPTPEESQAFIADTSPRAYENLIDQLLASPHYGERWGRHWLDVAGYSDSVGNAADELRPNSWEYRDWVIRALNEDKPYDQFLTEQLAGDQLVNYEPGTRPKPEQVDALIATGFLRVPPDITDTQSIYQVDKWYDALQTTVETSMKATMGLTIGCAKCHDHKFDPILQEDYYRLTAIYQSVWDPENWLPPVYQGTLMNVENAPIPNLTRANGVSESDQQDFLRNVNGLNRLHQKDFPLDPDFESRIANFELAARMQLEASQVADISKESKATRELYGIDDPLSGGYGARCLTARRLIESGVRFVSVINGQWDHHSNIKEKIEELTYRTDQGVAALLADLKARGLLDETLVVWAGEFGRLPTIESRQEKPGRDHNPYGFNIWMAGGGVKAGAEYGETDELGWQAVEELKVSHHDVHATIMHLLGLDVNKLTYEYEGRDETLTGVQKNRVVHEILADS